MEFEKFQKFYRKERGKQMGSSLDYSNYIFKKYGYDKKPLDYFKDHPDDFIYSMREKAWSEFVPFEKEFTVNMVEELMDKTAHMDTFKAIIESGKSSDDITKEVIKVFTELYDEHLYQLHLSNTQSRRSRAGTEFEGIVNKLLTYNNIRSDTQGVIGQKAFEKAGLGKAVDHVVPGIEEYKVNKQRCMLISSKTTLRERWAEVSEEIQRTGAHMVYLVTLDDGITNEVVKNASVHNIVLVLPDELKKEQFPRNQKVIGISELLKHANDVMAYWNKQDPSGLPEGFYEIKAEMYADKLENAQLDSDKAIYEKHKEFFDRKVEETVES